MSDYESWLKNIILSTKEYKEIKCPLLVGKKCTIYHERPNCCRKYPQPKGYYCSNSFCAVLMNQVENNSEKSSDLCFQCRDICCNHILVPVGQEITAEFMKKWMDVSCELCKKYFK